MDSFEWNKIFGAVLGSLLLIFVLREVAGIVFHAESLEEPASMREYAEAAGSHGDDHGNGGDEPAPLDIPALMAAANAGSGERLFARCAACHNVQQGGANGVGPNLWGIVGRDIASVDGYSYSNALLGKDGAWTFENLFAFLEKPAAWAPGTKMVFAGLSRETQRANLIAYLNQQSSAPLPLPTPAAAVDDTPAEVPAATTDAPAEHGGEDGETAGH